MGMIDAFLLLGLFCVGVPVAGAVGWGLEKIFHSPWLGRLPVLVVLVTALAGVPLALQFAGVPTTGHVVSRREVVKISQRDGSWFSAQHLVVRFLPAHAEWADPSMRADPSDSVTLTLRSTAAMFDRTPVGAAVPVTYVSFRPSIAKLSDRTLGDLGRELRARGSTQPVLPMLGTLALVVGLTSWSAVSPTARRVRRTALALLGPTLVVLIALVGLGSPAHGPDGPMPATAAARVRGISTIVRGRCFPCRRGHTSRLNQPLQVVELAFTPGGARWPVATADAIDSGSVRGLTVGSVVPMRYAPDVPREARVEGAARTFEVRNGRDAMVESAVIVAVLVLGYLVVSTTARGLWRRISHAA